MNEKEVKSGLKLEEESEIQVIEPGDPKWFEIVDYKGEKAKHYPYTGAFISVKTGKIMGNQGGRQDFDGPAMDSLAKAKKKEAIIDALTIVAVERGFGMVPTATLAAIVKTRIEVALDNKSRAGNDAAKLILSLTDYIEEESGAEGPKVRIDIYSEESKAIIKKILDL